MRPGLRLLRLKQRLHQVQSVYHTNNYSRRSESAETGCSQDHIPPNLRKALVSHTPLLSTLVSCAYLKASPSPKLWVGCLLLVSGSVVTWRSVCRVQNGGHARLL